MIKSIAQITLLLSLIFNQGQAFASARIDDLVTEDRAERIQKINDLTNELNLSVVELARFKAELNSALVKSESTGETKIRFRNASLCVAAVGFIATVLYQSKGINPSKVILGGGYTVSTLASVIGYFQNKSLRLTREEILKLTISVTDLEKKVAIEKKNLAKEVRLLCLSDGGAPDFCDRD